MNSLLNYCVLALGFLRRKSMNNMLDRHAAERESLKARHLSEGGPLMNLADPSLGCRQSIERYDLLVKQEKEKQDEDI